MQEGDLKW